MKTTFALIAAAATLLSVPAFAAGSCLRQDQIYSWHPITDRALMVENDFHKKFKLTLLSPCQELQFHERLGLKTFSGSALSCISKGDEILSGTPIGPQHCVIKTVEDYTPEMEKADKDAEAAKKAAGN
jgi:uncharacterized protein DUF6491